MTDTAAEAQDDDAARPTAGQLVSALLRRIRRTADLSQRELASALGLPASTVARAETGARDLPATVLARAAEAAGLRLGLLDAAGQEVAGMTPAAVRDRAGRHFPAHLDVRHGDVDWWHGDERYSRERPRYTFDRNRPYRDRFRQVAGTPPDHRRPRPGDSLTVRARVRAAAAAVAERDRLKALAVERRRQGIARKGLPEPVCTCPAACDLLLFTEESQSARLRAVPHVEDCPCRCDIA